MVGYSIGDHGRHMCKGSVDLRVILSRHVRYWGCEREQTIVTYMARYRDNIMSHRRHVAADIFAPIVNAGVAEAQEGRLYKLSSADRHELCVLSCDTEFHVVKGVQVLQECTSVRQNLTHGLAPDAYWSIKKVLRQ